MKRRRRNLAAGLVVALVGFGGPIAASSDNFGSKIQPPPPPRPNLANQGSHEHGEGQKPLTISSAGSSSSIIPPPPPRQRLNGTPPPRIPPPPPRESQSIQASKTRDQQRDPPPPPPPRGSEVSNIKDDAAGNLSERLAKDGPESIEQPKPPSKVSSIEKTEEIDLQHRLREPPPPPARPAESNELDHKHTHNVGNKPAMRVEDEPKSIESGQQPQKTAFNLKPEGIELHQRRVPPPPPRRPDSSHVGATTASASESPVKFKEVQIESITKPKDIESGQSGVPPPPARRPGASNVGAAKASVAQPSTKDEGDAIDSKAMPQDSGSDQRHVFQPPPRAVESSKATIGDESERPATQEIGLMERMQQRHKLQPDLKPKEAGHMMDPLSKPSETAKEKDAEKESRKDSYYLASAISEETTQQSENKEALNSQLLDAQPDATFSLNTATSATEMKSSQEKEEPQNEEVVKMDEHEASPLIAKSGLDPNTGTAFIRRQDPPQRSDAPFEGAGSLRHPQQGAFTMPLTHQQPNHIQQQNRQGYYRQMPSPQHPSIRRTYPSNVRRQPPRTSNAASSTQSFFKSIMGSVEKGLDELSNVEEKIAKRAQKLVSNAASSSGVSNVVHFATSKLSSTRPSRSIRPSRSPPAKTSPASSSSDKSPFAHLGKKFESVNDGGKESSSSSSQPAVTQKLIRANGGASAPGGQTPSQPIPRIPLPAEGGTAKPAQPDQRQQQQPQQRQPGQQQLYSQSAKQGTGPGSMPGTQSPFGANPYKPATAAQKPDPHSRESRIPWETSKTGTSRPSQTPRPVPTSFEEDSVSWKEKLMGAIPRFPRLPNPAKLFRFRKNKSYQYASMEAWKADDDDSRGGFFGLFKKKSSSALPSHSAAPHIRPSTGITESTKTPIDELLARSNGTKTTSLLAASDEAKCRSLGRYHATFDLFQVMFLILGVQQLTGLDSLKIPNSLLDVVTKTIPMSVEIIRASMTTWAPFCFAYALLTNISKNIALESKVQALAGEVATSVEEESVYGQLYLRLIASTPMDTRMLSRLSEAAQSEVKWMIAKARLNSFTTFMAGLLLFMTATVLRPAMTVVGKAALDIVTLQDLRSWPIEWKSMWSHFVAILSSSFQKLQTLFANVLVKALDKPLDVAFHVSIFGALLLATVIPKIESQKAVPAIDDEEEEMEFEDDGLDQISRLGASSATRLTMLSENGSVESVLERWRAMNVPPADLPPSVRLSQTLRQMSYVVLAGLTSFAPLLIPYRFHQASSGPGLHTGLQWDSMLDVSVILASVFWLIWNTLKQSTVLQTSLPYVKSFLSDLSKTMEEITNSTKQQADLKLSASISANAGLAVRDLWAAHTTKRAWAVRGANLECRNGEVLAVLGDDSSGKSRLLTTIAESLITPPKRSRTSNKVRGLVSIGGLDASKWDKASLKRRLGILLSDVRTLGDTACIFSGWTLEEILEPVDGVQVYPRTLTSSEKSAILLGLKITGLYETLMRRLPSKMNTVITGNEEDLGKPSVDPSTTVLSPAEWSKLLLAKVIAQTISDNDNVLASTDKVENSLMGSVLILDDVAVLLSEVEEAKVIRELRQTGAATVISSNKWATGRFADRIAVVKDGAIVEVGSHNELIARGPQRSLYAAKWHAMTMG